MKENEFGIIKVEQLASCNILKSSMGLEGLRQSIFGFIKSLNSYHNQYKIAKRYGLVEEIDKPVIFYFETLREAVKQ